MRVGIAGRAHERGAAVPVDAEERLRRAAAAVQPSIATLRSPSVPFLNPTGIDRPDASWRWIWLSVVRAPMAPQLIRSAMYCGLIGSRNSVAVGRPERGDVEQEPRGPVRRPVGDVVACRRGAGR